MSWFLFLASNRIGSAVGIGSAADAASRGIGSAVGIGSAADAASRGIGSAADAASRGGCGLEAILGSSRGASGGAISGSSRVRANSRGTRGAILVFAGLVFAGLGAGWHASPALAWSDSGLSSSSDFPFVGEVIGSEVQLRAGFSQNYRSLRALEVGERVIVQEERQGWFKVTVPRSYNCWINRRFVDQSTGDVAQVASDAVNLRPTASAFYFPVGRVDRGTPVTVLAEKGEWLQIVAPPEVPAWVNRKFIKNIGPVSSHAAELQRQAEEAERKQTDLIEERRRIEEAKLFDVGLESELEAAISSYADLRHESQAANSEIPMDALEDTHAIYERVASQATGDDLKTRAETHVRRLGRTVAYRNKIRESRQVLDTLASDLETTRSVFQGRVAAREAESVKAAATPDFETGWVEKGFDITKVLPYYRLMKGGRILAVIKSHKYNLNDFVNRKVVVRGEQATATPGKAADGVFWIQSLEVIGGMAKPESVVRGS